MGSVIKRATNTSIKREEAPTGIRYANEIAYATTMGQKPHEVKSLYRDIYEFYQNNEV